MLTKTLLTPQENDEDLLGLKASYLSVIKTLMYLTNYTRSNIAFAINFLSKI